MDDKAAVDKKGLEDYVDRLIKEKNSPNINDANRAEIRDELLKSVSEAVNNKMIAALSDEQVAELNKLLDEKAQDDAIQKFFSDKIPNLEQLVTEALLEFRTGYLTVTYNKEEKKDVKDDEELPPAPPAPKMN